MRAYISSFRGPFGTTQVGVEIGATYRVARRLSLIASYSYNDSIYDDDTVNGTAFVPTKGVRIVDTPAHLPRGEINYDDGMFFGNVAGAFTSRHNVTYTDDVSVNGYTLLNAAVDYRFPANSALAGVEIQVNAVNPTDASLVASTAVTQFQTFNRNLRLRTPDIR
ncbi:hypothetical protein C8J46_102598 [Sphingomonas sp. PP-F2F-A104-K0414]|uniref:TonB-dependent receptor domain-containing protein n=1 Tax=Sphingomonas sp. PP-F2F-A104-K0414 TaxID=2135661 RepID=UPI0010445F2B|nr:TonB-dependent receptor [Sphingomonas sp. PP-F2F-A104-K0414]TCQ00454.1 hypothetical protein C8J46_102598 [Sphingomonas sp. PP-F2F-A104-K0414]